MSREAKRAASGATWIGFTAILFWSSLALLGTWAGRIPPFELTALGFGISTLAVALKWRLRGESALGFARQPRAAWWVGVGGLFGFHFFYFLALQHAPPVEASLITYLWPLLIVVLSGLLPSEPTRLRLVQVAGALLGLAGSVVVVSRGGAVTPRLEYLPGYLFAFACGLIWAVYSVLNRRVGAGVPTDTVGWFCGASGALALACHLLFERSVWPDLGEWLILGVIGLGPMGLAFFAWDHGVKRGNIRTLGLLSYAAPLLSTAWLVLGGKAELSRSIGLGGALIVGGALLGQLEWPSRPKAPAAALESAEPL